MTLPPLVPLGELPSVRAALAAVRSRAPHHGLPALDPGTRERVCAVVVSIAPHLATDRLTLLVRYALWSVVLDDRIDTPPPRPATRRATTAAGTPDPDPLPTTLGGILRHLSHYDPTGVAWTRCARTLREAITDGTRHRRLGQAVVAGTRPPPTAEEYLAVAARTVNYLSFAYALLAVTGFTLAPSHVDRLAPALRHAAYAIRLANDLRSVERDRATGALNVLALYTADHTAVTPRWVRQEITRHCRAHDHALTRRHTQPPVARALRRSLRTSLALYQLADLR